MLMLAYGRGRWAVSQKRIQIQSVPCEPSFFTASPKAFLGTFSNDDNGGDSNDSAKKGMGLLSKTTTLHVHHAFLFISLPSRENARFHALWRTQTSDDEFFFLFLNLSAVDKKSSLGKFAYI